MTIKITALCPHEIGDTITIGREIHPPELAFKVRAEEHTITDIVFQHSTNTGETAILYELDGRGPLVKIQEPRRKKRRK